jgi:hypothetical protein
MRVTKPVRSQGSAEHSGSSHRVFRKYADVLPFRTEELISLRAAAQPSHGRGGGEETRGDASSFAHVANGTLLPATAARDLSASEDGKRQPTGDVDDEARRAVAERAAESEAQLSEADGSWFERNVARVRRRGERPSVSTLLAASSAGSAAAAAGVRWGLVRGRAKDVVGLASGVRARHAPAAAQPGGSGDVSSCDAVGKSANDEKDGGMEGEVDEEDEGDGGGEDGSIFGDDDQVSASDDDNDEYGAAESENVRRMASTTAAGDAARDAMGMAGATAASGSDSAIGHQHAATTRYGGATVSALQQRPPTSVSADASGLAAQAPRTDAKLESADSPARTVAAQAACDLIALAPHGDLSSNGVPTLPAINRAGGALASLPSGGGTWGAGAKQSTTRRLPPRAPSPVPQYLAADRSQLEALARTLTEFANGGVNPHTDVDGEGAARGDTSCSTALSWDLGKMLSVGAFGTYCECLHEALRTRAEHQMRAAELHAHLDEDGDRLVSVTELLTYAHREWLQPSRQHARAEAGALAGGMAGSSNLLGSEQARASGGGSSGDGALTELGSSVSTAASQGGADGEALGEARADQGENGGLRGRSSSAYAIPAATASAEAAARARARSISPGPAAQIGNSSLPGFFAISRARSISPASGGLGAARRLSHLLSDATGLHSKSARPLGWGLRSLAGAATSTASGTSALAALPRTLPPPVVARPRARPPPSAALAGKPLGMTAASDDRRGSHLSEQGSSRHRAPPLPADVRRRPPLPPAAAGGSFTGAGSGESMDKPDRSLLRAASATSTTGSFQAMAKNLPRGQAGAADIAPVPRVRTPSPTARGMQVLQPLLPRSNSSTGAGVRPLAAAP